MGDMLVHYFSYTLVIYEMLCNLSVQNHFSFSMFLLLPLSRIQLLTSVIFLFFSNESWKTSIEVCSLFMPAAEFLQ